MHHQKVRAHERAVFDRASGAASADRDAAMCMVRVRANASAVHLTGTSANLAIFTAGEADRQPDEVQPFGLYRQIGCRPRFLK